MLFRLYPGSLCQQFEHLLGTASGRTAAHVGIGISQCHTLREDTGYVGINRHAVLSG